MYTVVIEGLEAYGYHGATAEERAIGHRYRIDLKMLVDGLADATDNLSDTVDYSEIADRIRDVLAGAQHITVEHLAGVVANDLLDWFSKAIEINVKVMKLLPPMPHIVSGVGVELTRARANR